MPQYRTYDEDSSLVDQPTGEPTEVAPEMTASSKKPSEANGYALTLNPAHP